MNPELLIYEALAKETMRQVMAEESPTDIHSWLFSQLSRLGGGDESAAMTWLESFDFTDNMLAEYERIAAIPEDERKVLTWPWQTWRNLMDTLDPGILVTISAPDGQGKTILAESCAEHWAKHQNNVVFIHYELNRNLMMLRRTARQAGITASRQKSGKMTDEEKAKVREVRKRLITWDGQITYLHTPGWTMEKTVAELRKLNADGKCDVVVLDYLEKVSASRRQLQMFGANIYQREADNVEQLKVFSESTAVPTIQVTQMRKDAKSQSFSKFDRTAVRGAGEKSDKANIVIMLQRERIAEGYSNEVNILVDKNTMGATGTFTQIMQPQFFRIGDIVKPY